ncbi:MAG TPA: hypothetical protein VFS21_36565 [Roseiflexaceae bacterium]|nr:hypothetical protein [Roseiflexaceae bacterium]
MNYADGLRYLLLGGVVATAEANRRHYRMTTTWLPHLLIDAAVLLLPEIARRLPARDEASAETEQGELAGALSALRALVCDNPRYALYVAPLVLGYLTSNPRFNIYKGELAELRCCGFGLDAIPHSATAFALTGLIWDAAEEAARHCTGSGPLARLSAWAHQNPALASGLALALATAVWELGEYRIYQHELSQRGSAEAINMQWSPTDTLFDCLSNALGWAAAAAWRGKSAARVQDQRTAAVQSSW